MQTLSTLATALARTEGITLKEAYRRVRLFCDILTKAACDEGVSIRESFTIQPKIVKGRKVTLNGKTVTTKDSRILKISTGKRARDLLNSDI